MRSTLADRLSCFMWVIPKELWSASRASRVIPSWRVKWRCSSPWLQCILLATAQSSFVQLLTPCIRFWWVVHCVKSNTLCCKPLSCVSVFLVVFIEKKRSLQLGQLAHTSVAYTGFCSRKRLGFWLLTLYRIPAFLVNPGISHWQFDIIHLYSRVERGALWECLSQEHKQWQT